MALGRKTARKPGRRSSATGSEAAFPGPAQQAVALCVAGIGASAGGLDAIRELLRALPPDSGIAFVVIQHLDPQRKSLACELLAKCTTMPVAEASDGMVVAPDHVYTNPAGSIVSIHHGVLQVARMTRREQRHLPIDHFFTALGADQHERAIGIILSGSGADGAFGLRSIVENGGMVLVQAPESAQFDGMPRSAIQSGLASAVLPIGQMPQALLDYARHPYAAGVANGIPASRAAAELEPIMGLLRTRRGFDFSGYKRAMLLRRVQRRMGLRGIKRVSDYVAMLNATPAEADALFKDLLIGVTEFFRDQAAWNTLDTEVIKPLVDSRATDEPIRVWVAGAATGEEAYSMAILLIERLEAAGKRCAIQIFASDTNEDALAIARAGIYPAGIAARMSAQRLRRFFAETTDHHHFQVRDELRSSIVFCAHNLLRDPPYSKMDVVSCRNLLIYLEPEIQQKAMRILHFALREGGYLLLGAAETVGGCEAIFRPVSRK